MKKEKNNVLIRNKANGRRITRRCAEGYKKVT